MAKRRLARRTVEKPVRKQVEPEEFEDLEDEIEEFEEEEEEEELVPRRVSRRVVEEDISDEDEEEEEAEEEDEEPVPVKKHKAPAAKKEYKAPTVEKKTDPISIKKVDQVIAENVFSQMFEAMEDGNAIVVTKLGENKWQIVKGNAVQLGVKKISNSEAWAEMISQEYVDWNAAWTKKSYEQKKAYAKKIGAKWEAHEDERVDVMRLTASVRSKEGIEKYKPEYRTRAARAALRGG
jgi:hypothetical protein